MRAAQCDLSHSRANLVPDATLSNRGMLRIQISENAAILFQKSLSSARL